MQQLHLRVANQEDWLKFFDASIPGGGVFCPSTEPPDVGSEVRLEITFVGGPRFIVRGTVIWRRLRQNDPRARAGAGVKLAASEETKLSYVNAWVRGGVIDKREQRRLPVRLRVTYSARAARRINFTRDLSTDGLFLRSQELFPLHTPVQLVLSPPSTTGQQPISLRGTVARLVEAGSERGMGIKLDFKDRQDSTRFAEFVEELEKQYLTAKLPDDVIS